LRFDSSKAGAFGPDIRATVVRGNQMNVPKLWPILLLLLSTICAASTLQTKVTPDAIKALSIREQRIFRPAVHDEKFSDVPHATARTRCEDTRPPEALTTPDPPLVLEDSDESVTVSVIIGADGNVHSPLILQGGDLRQQQAVLNTVRHWRYRPATCNGVPTEAEAKIEFSRR
jgi:TonB family protein